MADFGASRERTPTSTNSMQTSMTMTMAGTPVFMAPEVLRQDRYGNEADVWSFGGLLVHIATRCPPYTKLLESMPPFALMQAIAQGEIRPTSDIDDLCPDWPEPIQQLAERCCLADRAERPSFKQIANELQEQFRQTAHTAHDSGQYSSSHSLARPNSVADGRGYESRRHSLLSAASPKVRGSEAVLSSFDGSSRRSLQLGGAGARGRPGSPGRPRFVVGKQSSAEAMGARVSRLEQARERASQRERLRASAAQRPSPQQSPTRDVTLRKVPASRPGSARLSGASADGQGRDKSPSPRVSISTSTRPQPPPPRRPPSGRPSRSNSYPLASHSPSWRSSMQSEHGGGSSSGAVGHRPSAGVSAEHVSLARGSEHNLPPFPNSSSTLQGRSTACSEAGPPPPASIKAASSGALSVRAPSQPFSELYGFWRSLLGSTRGRERVSQRL